MKRLNYLVLALLLVFASCSSDDETTPATVVEEEKKGELSNVETKPTDIRSSEAAKSTQIESKIVEGSSLIQPGMTQSVDAKRKAEILTGAARKTKTSSGHRVAVTDEDAAWLLDQVNGVDVTDDPDNDLVVFFLENGEYEIYDISEDEWDWGYWYISEDGQLMAFDLDSEDEWILSLEKLTPNQIAIKDIADSTVYTWNAYVLGEGEQTEFIDDAEELANILDDNVWSILEIAVNDTIAEDAFYGLFMYFDTDGEYAFSAQEESGALPEIDGGDFTVDFEEFTFTFDEGTEDEDDFYLIYLDEDFLVLAQEDEEGDFIEIVFEAVDLDELPSLMTEPDLWSAVAENGELIADSEVQYLELDDSTFSILDASFETLDSGTYEVEFNEFEYEGIDESGSGFIVFINDEFMVLFSDSDDEEDETLTTYQFTEVVGTEEAVQ